MVLRKKESNTYLVRSLERRVHARETLDNSVSHLTDTEFIYSRGVMLS